MKEGRASLMFLLVLVTMVTATTVLAESAVEEFIAKKSHELLCKKADIEDAMAKQLKELTEVEEEAKDEKTDAVKKCKEDLKQLKSELDNLEDGDLIEEKKKEISDKEEELKTLLSDWSAEFDLLDDLYQTEVDKLKQKWTVVMDRCSIVEKWGKDVKPEKPGRNQDKPGNGQDKPGNGQDKPGNGQDRPENGQDRPGNGQDKPGNDQDKPGKGQGREPSDGGAEDQPEDDASRSAELLEFLCVQEDDLLCKKIELGKEMTEKYLALQKLHRFIKTLIELEDLEEEREALKSKIADLFIREAFLKVLQIGRPDLDLFPEIKELQAQRRVEEAKLEKLKDKIEAIEAGLEDEEPLAKKKAKAKMCEAQLAKMNSDFCTLKEQLKGVREWKELVIIGSDTDNSGDDTDGNGDDTDGNGDDTDGNGDDTGGNGDDNDGNGDDNDGNGDDTNGNGDDTNGNGDDTNGNGDDTNGNGDDTNGNGDDTNGNGDDTSGNGGDTGDDEDDTDGSKNDAVV